MIRKLLWPIAALGALLAISAGIAAGDNGRENNKTFEYSVGLWGDLPYSDLQATTGVPNLIADMNASNLDFTVHDGDLKAGNGTPNSTTPTTCSDALYVQGLKYLNSLDGAAMITPGDNDWTDCDRASNGAYNSLERLDHERQVLFSTPYSQGTRPMLEEVQSGPNEKSCLGVGPGGNGTTAPTACVENRRWTYKGVTYATLNIQGSCNNLCDTAPDPNEESARNAADIQWLDETFAEAKANGSSALMLISQADPGFDTSGEAGSPLRNSVSLAETDNLPDGFQSFLLELRKDTIDFGRPVAYVHGDSHYFRIDKPLLDSTGKRIESFTRVETFGDNQGSGDNDVQWVKVLVDPSSRDVFAFQPQIVPANVPAYQG
jgi:hypothetical protein